MIDETVALKISSFGVYLLHDPNWTGMDLYDKIRHYRKSHDLFFKTIKDGLLWQIGTWLFEDYLQNEDRFENPYINLEGEYGLWYFEDYLAFLIDSGVNKTDPDIALGLSFCEEINSLYEDNEDEYYKRLDNVKEAVMDFCEKLDRKFSNIIEKKKELIADKVAERYFHDRVLCGHINKVVLEIGFHGDWDDTGISKKWIDRERFPEWAKKAIISRDRNKCSICGKNLIQELEEQYHIDHIIPLAQGGTNDLSNLQLLCATCNLAKSKNLIQAKTSIPSYLQKKK